MGLTRSDLIRRDEAFQALVDEYNRKRTGDGLRLAWIEKAINSVPTAQPRKKGKWLRGNEMPEYPRIPYRPWMSYCSECKTVTQQDDEYLYDYCPNCGADMRGNADE